MQPKVYVSYSQKRPHVVTALFYIEREIHLYGWFMAAGHRAMSQAFFMLENFYADTTPVLYRSLSDDVYDPWIIDSPRAESPIRNPLPADIGHELERLQSQFVDEWLFFETDGDAADELAAYQARGLPLHAANIKCRRLGRLHQECDEWVHVTPGIDFNVAGFIETNWHYGPLDDRSAGPGPD
jgi:hypothetical protein